MRILPFLTLQTLVAATLVAATPAAVPPAAPDGAAPAAPAPVAGALWQKPPAKAAAEATLLLGDSMMRIGVGPALKLALAGGGAVDVHAKSATGLARPDVYDWPAEVSALVAGRRFQRVIVFLGSNDCQTLAGPGGGAVFGTPAWERAYQARVQTVLASLCGAADSVLWLGLPPMRSRKFNGRVTALNGVLADAVEAAPCAHFVPTDAALADGKGGYAAYRRVKKRRLKIRDDDGVHITPTGGQLVADAVLAELAP